MNITGTHIKITYGYKKCGYIASALGIEEIKSKNIYTTEKEAEKAALKELERLAYYKYSVIAYTEKTYNPETRTHTKIRGNNRAFCGKYTIFDKPPQGTDPKPCKQCTAIIDRIIAENQEPVPAKYEWEESKKR